MPAGPTTLPTERRMAKPAARRWGVCASIIAAAFVLLYVAVRHAVPFGPGQWRDILPYYLFSLDRGEFVSPGGAWRVWVVSNDAGAMHNGNFPTWVIVRRWWGKQVVAEGYLDESRGPVPIRWTSETAFEIGFVAGRHSSVVSTVRVDLRD